MFISGIRFGGGVEINASVSVFESVVLEESVLTGLGCSIRFLNVHNVPFPN